MQLYPLKFFRLRYLQKYTDKYKFVSSIFRRSDKNSIITYRTASISFECLQKGQNENLCKISSTTLAEWLQNSSRCDPSVTKKWGMKRRVKTFFEFPNKQGGCNKQAGTFPRNQKSHPVYLCPF